MRWRLVVEYDGRAFAGWQVQPGQRTVQGEIETAVERFVGHPVRVTAAGRTDAGVHAWGQVVSFTTDRERTPRQVIGALNAMLPPDVACIEAAAVSEDFDPRRWSWGKHYRYRFLSRGIRSPLREGRVWLLPMAVDVERMHAAAQHWVGRHDFTSFRAQGCAALHPVRTIEALAVTQQGDELHFDAHGQGFLRHMIRIMAGTLVDVGKGRRTVDWADELLRARDRGLAGRTAPACGLELVLAKFGDGPPPWAVDSDE